MGNKDVPPNLNEMVDAVREELASADDPVVVRNVSRERIRELTETLLANYVPLEPRLDAELSKARAAERRAQLGELRRWSWVVYGADVQASEAIGASRSTQLSQLSARVAAHDRELLGWARPLFAGDPARAATVEDIARGAGRRDSAEDVLRLAKLYRDDWARISAMKIITKAELAAAEADATRQLELLGAAANNPARALAQRAYARWARDYTALRRTGRYLVEVEADGVARFPGIGSKSPSASSTKPKAEQSEAPAEQAAEVAESGTEGA